MDGKTSTSFQEALRIGSLKVLRLIPKSDLHNHAFCGGNRAWIAQMAGRDIAPLDHPVLPIRCGSSSLPELWSSQSQFALREVTTSPWRTGSSPSEWLRCSDEPRNGEPSPRKSFQPAQVHEQKLRSRCRNMPTRATLGAGATAIPLPRTLPLSHSPAPSYAELARNQARRSDLRFAQGRTRSHSIFV